MSLLKALEPYRDPVYRVISLFNTHPNPDANMHLWTSMAIDFLGEDRQELAQTHLGFIERCSAVPGLVARYPGNQLETSWDEIFSAAKTGWRSLNPLVARKILDHGYQTDWNWNNAKPNEWEWQFLFARNLMFLPFLRQCARMKVGQLSEIQWCVGLLLSLLTPKGNTSGKNLCRVQIEPMWDAGGYAKVAIQLWLWRMKRQYKGGPKEFLDIFVPGHPLAEYAPTEWSLRC